MAKKASYPLTLDAVDSPLLSRILKGKRSVLIPDTKQEADWKDFSHHSHLRSWLCVPLIASHHTLGLLSAGRVQPEGFNREDLRRAQLLAIPAAAAIQNSRLYECASIYGSELERRIRDVRQAKQALGESEESRKISEDKFQKVFRASPIAFSITTIREGRFLDVNEAFERRYGYRREELIGHTVHELRIWESPGDRVELLAHLHKGEPIRNVITRLRTKSGRSNSRRTQRTESNLMTNPAFLQYLTIWLITTAARATQTPRSEEQLVLQRTSINYSAVF